MFTKTKPKPQVGWTPDEQRRVDAFETACAILSNAICEHAGDYLVHRARVMAHCANRPFPEAATAALTAQGAALGAQLKEGLARLDWLALAWYLRRRDGDDTPSELHPLTALVESHLAPLRTSYGFVLRPRSGLDKPLDHCPLAAWTWPGPRLEKRCVTRSYDGLPPWRVMEDTWIPHPTHRPFQDVARAAVGVETVGRRKATAT